jgi:hypothetical protein
VDIGTIQLPIYPPDAHFRLERDIFSSEFACDLSKCKGACCTMPAERGAPILASEVSEIERVFLFAKKYLDKKALDTIEKTGLLELEADGTFTIPTIGGAECIFVHWEEGIAKCSIQTAFRNGEIAGYEKPISCHLFPIRIYPDEGINSFYICYEKLAECEGGRERGEKVHVPLTEFLDEPLVRALGKERLGLIMQHFVS